MLDFRLLVRWPEALERAGALRGAKSPGPEEDKNNMTKTELVAAIAERIDMSRTDVDKTLKGFIDVVSETVAKGDEKVSIPGFLTFEQTERKARSGRNPQTGEVIEIPAQKAVKVSAGSQLKSAVKA
jgi:DNA-binding protein HU-beta